MPGVCHWGPLTALGIVLTVTVTATYSALQLWALPRVRFLRLPNFILMYVWLFLILKNFYQALRGPGYVPLGWKPAKESDKQYLQFCRACQGYKPPRSHHCRQCGRCIKKMDHHCPWVNSCVGHDNHASFTRFVFYVPFGCSHGAIMNCNFVYRMMTYEFIYHRPYIPINMYWLVFVLAGIGLAIGATIGVLVLFIVQMRSICRNRTQIEDWIMDKAKRRRSRHDDPFIFPYDLGCWKNFNLVINLSGRTKGDGIDWQLKDGCSKYDFTIEQLEQKKIKKRQATICEVSREYDAASCAWRFGLATCICCPCSLDEGKIPLSVGDIITVTRWQRYWAYGDKQLPQAEVDQGRRVKGWFPRQCVRVMDRTSGKTSGKKQDNISNEGAAARKRKKKLN